LEGELTPKISIKESPAWTSTYAISSGTEEKEKRSKVKEEEEVK